jgi:hypothetical protein
MAASLAQSLPTKRAADVWESARFRSIFLASGFLYTSSIVHARHTQLTQTVGLHLQNVLKVDCDNTFVRSIIR